MTGISKINLIFALLCLSGILTAEEKLRRSLGKWPTGLHNTAYTTHTLKVDTSEYSVPLKGQAAVQAIYGIVGAPNKHHFTHVYSSEKGLIFGGPKTSNFSTVIWKFAALPGQAVKNGRIDVSAQLSGNQAADLKGTFVAVSPTFKFKGGGGFWHAFKNINYQDYKNHTSFQKDGNFIKASLPIPAHSKEFYVIISRKPGIADLKFALTNLTVKSTLNQTSGLVIHYPGQEPVWSAGDKVEFNVKAVNLSQQYVWWKLTKLYANSESKGAAILNNSQAIIDFTAVMPGFYKLDIYSDQAMQNSQDSQEFAVLSSQNPEYVKNSIFGSFGYPCIGGIHGAMGTPTDTDIRLMKKMGIRWVVTSALWAWRQSSPNAPINLDFMPLLKKLHKHNFEQILNTGTTPRWANGGKAGSAPPLSSMMNKWSDFNETVAKTTEGIVTWFQAWNEPNNPHALWQPRPWNFDKRSLVAKQIQRTQFEGLKKGNPDAKLIGGNFAGVPANWFSKWLTAPDSTLKYQNAMSGHPYCKVTRENNWEHRFAAEPNLIPRMLESRKAMDDHGAKDQPMFWTEYGWFTPKTAPLKQASWTARQNIIIQAYKDKTKTEALCIFSLGDIKNGHNLLRKNPDIKPGQHRLLPVIGSFATSASLLADSTPLPAISDYPNPIRCYAFKRDNTLLYAAWKTEAKKDNATITLPVTEPRTALKIDMMGGEQFVILKPGAATPLNANNQPEFYKLSNAQKLHCLDKNIHIMAVNDEPQSNTINVANLGTGSIPLNITTDCSWLNFTNKPTSVSAAQPTAITLTIDSAKLAAGQNTGIITLKSANQTITVNVTATRISKL